MTREQLRELARKHGVPRGRNTADTIENLQKAGIEIKDMDKSEIVIHRSLYLPCSCGCSILQIKDNPDHDDYEVSFQLYVVPGHDKTSLKYKLRQIWQILTTGSPYQDQVCLDSRDVEALKKFLNEI